MLYSGILITGCLSACDPAFEISFVNTSSDTLVISYDPRSLAAMHGTDSVAIRQIVFPLNQPYGTQGGYISYQVPPAASIVYRGGTGSGSLPVFSEGAKAFYVFNPRTHDTLFFNDRQVIAGRTKKIARNKTRVDIGIPKPNH